MQKHEVEELNLMEKDVGIMGKTVIVSGARTAFGKFGGLNIIDNWEDEARRYYFGIIGKYGQQVQSILNMIFL